MKDMISKKLLKEAIAVYMQKKGEIGEKAPTIESICRAN